MQSPGADTLVWREGAVLGMAMVRTAADEAEILAVAVAPDARRRGGARALLQEAAHCARERGAIRLHLEVASDNDVARSVYSRLGFVQTGRRARYYPGGADALLLSKPLT